MILKDKTFSIHGDPRVIAGDASEKQMAFYLKRAFGSAPDLYVLNDIRIEFQGEVAQMDHVVVSRWGLFIVESKSVSGSVRINSHGEWLRELKGSKQGMASPVRQAEMQSLLLKAYLQYHKGRLRNAMLGLQKGFAFCPINIYVAISDSGVIHRQIDLPEVMKADVVVTAIQSWLSKRTSLKSILSLGKDSTDWFMSTDEARSVADFLLESHVSRTVKPRNATNVKVETTSTNNELSYSTGDACPHCKEGKLVARKGRKTNNDFLGCSKYPKCKFTDYRNTVKRHTFQ